MLTTIEAEIDVSGKVTFLEPLNINKKSRAIITLLDDERSPTEDNADEKSNVVENGEQETVHPLELLGRLPKIDAPPDFSQRHDFYAHGKLEE